MKSLISVYDKTGIVEFARKLHQAGAEIISTGGTYRSLSEEGGLPVRQVSDLTGFPEILDGPGQDPPPSYSRRIAGPPRRRRPRGGACPPRHRYHRHGGREPLSLSRDHQPLGRHPGRRPGEHRHRRAHAAESGSKNFPFVTVVVDPADYDWVATGPAPRGCHWMSDAIWPTKLFDTSPSTTPP